MASASAPSSQRTSGLTASGREQEELSELQLSPQTTPRHSRRGSSEDGGVEDLLRARETAQVAVVPFADVKDEAKVRAYLDEGGDVDGIPFPIPYYVSVREKGWGRCRGTDTEATA